MKLHDIAQDLFQDRPVDISANHLMSSGKEMPVRALLCLEQCALPATVLNISGKRSFNQKVAEHFGSTSEKTSIYR
jgi:hypothetical protein